MIHAKGSSLQMAFLLAFLVSVVVLTSAIRSETGGNDRTSPVLSPKADGTANSPCCAVDIQVRLKRSPSTPGVGEVVSGKGFSIPILKQSQSSKGKESLSDMELRWQSTRDGDVGKSTGDNQVERERGNLEEVFEERRDGTSNGRWVAKNETSSEEIKPSAKTVDRITESDRKRVGSRKLGEDSRGINRFLTVGWSKTKSAQSPKDTRTSSRTRRDLRAIKRMLDDAGITPVDPDDFPEEGPPEISEEEPEMYEDNVEVPQMGESVSGDATRRQDFSKRPKYYPDWGPKRTWRINMMRVWGKRYLSGYDRNHALWDN